MGVSNSRNTGLAIGRVRFWRRRLSGRQGRVVDPLEVSGGRVCDVVSLDYDEEGRGEMSTSPIYVAGLERSGTSLTYALLGSHSNIAMSRRTNLWTHFYDQYGDLSRPENLNRCLEVMMTYKRLRKLEPDWQRLRADFEDGEPTYGRLFSLLEQQYASKLGKPRWGDKSLDTERYTEPILEAFPQAKILHMIRDPRDRFASSLARWKVRRGGVGVGSAEWLRSAEIARANVDRHPDNYMIVQYEALVSDPTRVLRDICSFIGEPYEEEMLSMDGARVFKQEGGNSSYGSMAPGEITPRSIGKYRTVLSDQQIHYVQRTAGVVMDEFGYDAEDMSFGPFQKMVFFAVRLPLEHSRASAWRVREAYLDRKGREVPSYRRVDMSPQGS